MLQLTQLFSWKSCPLTSIQFDEKSISQIESIQKKQQDFASKHNIPLIPLTPRITNYTTINNDVIYSKFKLWQARERFIYFNPGMSIWEFSSNIDKLTHIEDLKSLKVKGHKLFLNALEHKKDQCKKYNRDGIMCDNCKNRDLMILFTIIAVQDTSEFEHLKSLVEREDRQFQIAEFDLKYNIKRLMSKNYQLIYIPKDKWNSKTKLLDTFLWTSSLVKSYMNYGQTFLQRSMQYIPDFAYNAPKIEQQVLDRFYQRFFYHYFWLNPKFLLAKDGERLRLRTLPLNSFLFAYRTLDNKNYWEDYSLILNLLAKKPVGLVMELHEKCMHLPGNILHGFLQELNPFDFQMPSAAKVYSQLEELENNICMALIQDAKKLTRHKFGTKGFMKQISHSRSKIATMVGLSTGSQGPKVQGAIDKLVRKGFLVETTPEEIGKKAGRARYFYHLNPEFPYVSLSLKIQ